MEFLDEVIGDSALMWVKGSQLSCASEKPFHLIRYWSWLHLLLVPKISSTSHSGWPSISSGTGSQYLLPFMVVSLYGVSNKAWKMLWIFHDGGSLSWNEVLDTAKVTRNGPYLLGASLAEGWVVFRFCPSNHTQSPTQ
jgi:hypothetical protein